MTAEIVHYWQRLIFHYVISVILYVFFVSLLGAKLLTWNIGSTSFLPVRTYSPTLCWFPTWRDTKLLVTFSYGISIENHWSWFLCILYPAYQLSGNNTYFLFLVLNIYLWANNLTYAWMINRFSDYLNNILGSFSIQINLGLSFLNHNVSNRCWCDYRQRTQYSGRLCFYGCVSLQGEYPSLWSHALSGGYPRARPLWGLRYPLGRLGYPSSQNWGAHQDWGIPWSGLE